MIRALLILAFPALASCYQMAEGGELPAGKLEVEQFGGRAPTGCDLLEVNADGTFEVLSLYDARVCRGVLGTEERQRWRAIVRTLQEPWVRPPPDFAINAGGPRCASFEPGGQSTACWSDGGDRQRAANFAYELRSRFDDGDCEALDGAPVLVTSWAVTPIVGAELGVLRVAEVEWRDGFARTRPLLEDGAEWSECPAPTLAQRAQLDALAYAALDAIQLPRPEWYSLRDSPNSAWFELSQLYEVSVFVDSPYGQRGNRLLGESTAELYSDIGVAFAEVCEFATGDLRR